LLGKSCAAADSGNSSNDSPVASAPSILMQSSRSQFFNRSRIPFGNGPSFSVPCHNAGHF
jgi:hypothetical protein